MKKILLTLLIVILIVQTSYIMALNMKGDLFGAGGAGWQTDPTLYVSSSTTFTLTTASQRLLATSTPTRRIAATIQPIKCTVAQPIVFVNANNDVVATQNNGMAIFGTTTPILGSYPNLPVVQGSVQGIADAGTCTVLVTEWRSRN